MDSLCLRSAPMGRLAERVWIEDGVQSTDWFKYANQASSLADHALWSVRDAIADTLGAPWQVAQVCVDPAGAQGWVDFDIRPGGEIGRWGALAADNLLGELTMHPRVPGLVPGWMKVELAVAGLWDVERDVPSWDTNLQATAHPVPRAEVEAAVAGQPLVSQILFPEGVPVGLSRERPLVLTP